eukprot:TRINITY_DN46740_c0_g1_i1.p1 TRINITY_DN46740_c0_g1~~TRINITY_DN46740_c0_g1_i1.p1  ORF type:complete len:439 (+),score=50.05 TRINITY_DN46740_c0_g1_i1:88-1404(+)
MSLACLQERMSQERASSRTVYAIFFLGAAPWIIYMMWFYLQAPKTHVHMNYTGAVLVFVVSYGALSASFSVGMLLMSWYGSRLCEAMREGMRLQLRAVSYSPLANTASADGADGVSTSELVTQIMGECMISTLMLVPGCAIALLAAWSNSWTKVPSYIWVFAFLVVLRSKMREAALGKSSVMDEARLDFTEWTGFPSFPFLSTATDAIHGFSKGTAIVNAFVKDHQMQHYFALSFHGILPPCVHLWMCVLVSAVLSAFFKTGTLGIMLFTFENQVDALACCVAQFGGFGGLVRHFKKQNSGLNLSTTQHLISFAPKVFGDAVLALYWQSEILMCLGTPPDFVSAAPICISAMLALKGLFAYLHGMWSIALRQSDGSFKDTCLKVIASCGHSGQVSVYMIGATIAVCLISMIRLYKMHSCDSHRWGYYEGCVHHGKHGG